MAKRSDMGDMDEHKQVQVARAKGELAISTVMKSKLAAGEVVRRVSSRDARMLTRSIQLEETEPPYAFRGIVHVVALLIIGFVLWASLTPFAEKVVAIGTVIPAGQVQSLATIGGGRVAGLYVQDGARVETGMPLLELDRGAEQAAFVRATNSLAANELEARNLTALLAGTAPTYEGLANVQSDQLEIAQRSFNALVAAREADRQVLAAQLRAAKALASSIAAEVEALADQVAALKETSDRRERLFQSGSGSRLNYLDSRARYSEMQAEFAQRQGAAQEQAARITEVENLLAAFEADFIAANQARLQLVRQQVDILVAEKRQLQRQIEDGIVRAPGEGVISGLTLNRVGAVVDAGQTIMSLVPDSQSLLAEVRISPRDVGQLIVGQSVLIRVDGYRFGRVGGVPAVVERIAADPREGDNGEKYFNAWVRLEQSFVGADPASNRIIAGMEVTADIRVGEKSLMAYLLRPVEQSLSVAFSER